MVKGLVRGGVQVGLCLELGLILGSGAKGGFSVTGQSWDPGMFWNRITGPGWVAFMAFPRWLQHCSQGRSFLRCRC